MSEIELIKIENFGKFETYSKELLDFIEINKIKCIGINSMSGQVLALLTCEENRNKHIDGFGLQEFIDKIGLKSRDVIYIPEKLD